MLLILSFFVSQQIGKAIIKKVKLLPFFYNLIALTLGEKGVKSLWFIKIIEEIKSEGVCDGLEPNKSF